MNQERLEQIRKIFLEQRGFARTRDLTMNGISNQYLYRLETEGFVVKVKNGLYRWSDSDVEMNEWEEISALLPKGVLCLHSALSYYELTTYNPWEYNVAIHRDSRKPVLPDYPPIKIFFFSSKQYELGIQLVDVNGGQVKIYNREKTLCDLMRYKSKIGTDLVNEAFKNYVISKNKNISQLLEYAEILRLKKQVYNYLEVLL